MYLRGLESHIFASSKAPYLESRHRSEESLCVIQTKQKKDEPLKTLLKGSTNRLFKLRIPMIARKGICSINDFKRVKF